MNFALKTTFANIMIGLAFLVLAGCSTLPDNSSTTSANNLTAANYNVQLGVAYLQQGHLQRAKQKLLLALQQAPDWPPAQDAMGYYYEATGNNTAAATYFRRALALAPNSGVAQNNYGTFLCRSGHYQEAEKYFLSAVQDPHYLNSAEAYENAGLCAMGIPDENKAKTYFLLALQQNPQRSTSLLELADINAKQKNYRTAQDYLNRYFKATHKPDRQALLLGLQLAKQRGDTKAVHYYHNLLQQAKKSTTANDNE